MKSTNRTFRIDEDLLKTVHELALRKKVSMNEFVVDAIREAIASALMDGIEMEEVPSSVMLKFMEYLPTERVAELGRWSAVNFSRKFVWQIFKELSPDTVIKAYEAMAEKYQHFFSFEHHMEDSDHILKIRHSRGQKWSIYYGESMRATFKELLGVAIDVEWGPNEIEGRFRDVVPSRAQNRKIPIITG
jgi:Ribbon-helix-helix protein, copG family